MNNQKIRAEAAKYGVKLWQIAEAVGLAESTFSRSLRHEVSAERRAEIIAVIHKIAGGSRE